MDPILLQKQVRDNSEDLRTYLKELQGWEDEMKRKESTSNEKTSQSAGTCTKIKRTDKSSKKGEKKTQRIKGYDYRAWDKFDVEAECKKLDDKNNKTEEIVEEVETSESDEFDSSEEYLARLRDEATYEKERGNQFVRQQKWREAISCYTHAISCYSKDPIFYANRALCYLKKKEFHNAEADCTSALQFDPNYVKALQRRAAARTELKQSIEAIADLKRVLQLEPNNSESKKELEKLEKSIGENTKKSNSSSDVLKYIPPTEKKQENTSILPSLSSFLVSPSTSKTTIIETLPSEKVRKSPELNICWPQRPNAKPIKTVQKLPHLRSKTPLHMIKVVEVKDEPKQEKFLVQANTNKKSAEALESKAIPKDIEIKQESIKLVVPKSSVQFISNWKLFKNNEEFKFKFLKQIKPNDIPKIFQEALEIDLFVDILTILLNKFPEQNLDVFLYLKYFSIVKRFSTLMLFMPQSGKITLHKLFEYCIDMKIPQEDIDLLQKKYEV